MKKRLYTFSDFLSKKIKWDNIVEKNYLDMGNICRQEYWHARNEKIAKNMENMFNIFSGFMRPDIDNITALIADIYNSQLTNYSQIILKKKIFYIKRLFNFK